MNTATVSIDGKEMRMRASALIPRLYRFNFGRDIMTDMNSLRKNFKKIAELPEDATEDERTDAQLSATDLTIFENVAWLMLKHGGEDVGENPDEWLESIDGVFSVYTVMPTILKLWTDSLKQTSTAKKK